MGNPRRGWTSVTRTLVAWLIVAATAGGLGWKYIAFSRDYSLWDAAWSSNHGAVERLLRQGANPDASWQGLTARAAASFRGYESTALLLLDHGADPRRAWRQALREDRPALLRSMLAHGLPARGEAGREVLFSAISAGHCDDVTVLLRAGADPNIPEPGTGRTALGAAQACVHAPARRRLGALLRAAGARESK